MTKKLFYEDAFKTQFTSYVQSCAQLKDGYGVILDATLFYPEGGGQPADTGRLGNTRVLDARETDGGVLHVTDAPLDAGMSVEGHIDWERRFSLMQHHTAEHIMSGIIDRLFGFRNVGFHMGADFVTLDIDGELDAGQLEQVELLSNRAIYEDIPVKTELFASQADGPAVYRSKKSLSGQIRIVTVPGYDACACCGLHCARTGQVGVVKIIEAKHYKGGMRISILAGEKAVSDYGSKHRSVQDISALLSARTCEVTDGVRRILDENCALRQELTRYKNELFKRKAEEIPENTGVICLFENNLSPDDLRKFCLLLCERAEIAAVFSGADIAFKYAVGSKTADMRELGKKMNTALHGRGGGSKPLIQGNVGAAENEIKAFFNENISF